MTIRFGIRVVLAVVPAALVFGAVLAQQPAPAPAAGSAPPQAANMTGRGGFVDSADLRVSRLKMEAGARTYWHSHPSYQIIVAEDGQGLYQEKGGPVKKFLPGQAIFLKANVVHWHGAAPTSAVTQTTMYAGAPTWGAAVDDAEYGGKKR